MEDRDVASETAQASRTGETGRAGPAGEGSARGESVQAWALWACSVLVGGAVVVVCGLDRSMPGQGFAIVGAVAVVVAGAVMGGGVSVGAARRPGRVVGDLGLGWARSATWELAAACGLALVLLATSAGVLAALLHLGGGAGPDRWSVPALHPLDGFGLLVAGVDR